MNAVIQFPGAFQQPEQTIRDDRSGVMRNKKRGFAAFYRSLLDDDWTKDAYLLAAWTRLVLRASSSEQTVNYNGQDWSLARGQLVIIPSRFANEMRDRQGKPMSRQAVVRMLEWFEQNGMIVRAGYDKGTVITICNYDPYQSLVNPTSCGQPTVQQPEHLGEHLKPNDSKALVGDAVHHAEQPTEHLPVPEEQPCKTTKINNQDQETLGAGTAEAAPDPVAEQDVIPPDAAIHAKRGKTLRWGTQDDLTCATWLIEKRVDAFSAKGLAEPKKPDLVSWVNDVRLMRQHDNRTHREICELFSWVCRTGRELEYCQAPATLRDKWDGLQLRKANSETGVTRGQKPASNVAAAQAMAQSIIESGKGGYNYDKPL
jgi:hypothetical protein